MSLLPQADTLLADKKMSAVRLSAQSAGYQWIEEPLEKDVCISLSKI
jgi:hypothetical protein